MPEDISSALVGKFLSLPPSENPKIELKKVTAVIKRAGLRMWFSNSESVIPAEKASMLVAIPTKSRHFRSMQSCFSFFVSKASIMNLAPRYVKMRNTISPAYGSIIDLTKFVI